MAEISPIKYSKELQKVIFPDSSFYKKSFAEVGVADNVTSVERPIQGDIDEAKTGDISQLPLKVKVANDSKDSYSTTLVYAPPIAIDTPSEYALNYNKRATKQAQQAAAIEKKCGDLAVINWAPTNSAQLLVTTGSGRASNVTGLTGNRKAVQKADMLKLFNLLLRMNTDQIGGKPYGLVTADFYTDLLGIAEFVDYDKTGNYSKLEKGILGSIMGIEIMTRSTSAFHTGLMFDNASTPVVNGISDSIVATDRPGNLFWYENLVCRAEGVVRTIINDSPAGYMGATVIESKVRFGAAHSRYDQMGVVAMLEDNV